MRQHKSVCQRQCQIKHVGVGSPITLDFDELGGDPALEGEGGTSTTQAVTREILRIERNQRRQIIDTSV